MQKYEEKPIPVVLKNSNQQYYVNPEALQFFSSIEGKLAIISVAGLYRTGKSFLLNTILLDQKNGFQVGSTTNAKTKGLWVWGKPMILKNQNDEIINVLVLDSEGLGSTEEDVNHDLRLFSITLLLSSAFMYNTLGSIDENAIDSLGLVLKLCEYLRNEKFNDFPDFYWILRDFSLALIGKDNNPLTTQMYLENCLSSQPNDSELRNKIRQSIKMAFTKRHCFTFVRPLTDQASLQNVDKMSLEELRPEFVEQVLEFRKHIFNNLKIKSIKGKEIRGSMLADLIKIYVQSINGNQLPLIENGWEQLCLKELHEVLDEIENSVADKVISLKDKLPRTKKQLKEQQEKLMEEFAKIFSARLKNNSKAAQYFGNVQGIVEKEMRKIQSEMKVKNISQTHNFIKKQFQNVEKRLKQSQFKNMGQLVKEFEVFYEYYKKKCPYKDELEAGMQLLMKKFSDCSLLMYKTLQKKKQTEIQNLKAELEDLRSEVSSKDDKLKQEKSQHQNNSAVLEIKIQQLTNNNKSLMESLMEIEQKLNLGEENKRNNESAMDELQSENLQFKRKIIQVENQFKELECSRNHEVSVLEHKLVLLQNQIKNIESSKQEIFQKHEETMKELLNCKEEMTGRISEITSELEKLQKQKQDAQQQLNQKIHEKETELKQIEGILEEKCDQLSETKESLTLQIQLLSQQLQEQKQLVEKNKQSQISSLKDTYISEKNLLQEKIKKQEIEIAQKQSALKQHKSEAQQQKAVVEQQLAFMAKEIEEKQGKMRNLQKQNANYANLFEEKDQEVSDLLNEIQQLKAYNQAQSQQVASKIIEINSQLEQKNNMIRNLELELRDLTEENRNNQEKIKTKEQQSENMAQKAKAQQQALALEIDSLSEKNAEIMKEYERQLEGQKHENSEYVKNIKESAELSLIQLKNFYQMEKQRMGKKMLEERKKYETNEATLIKQMENKLKIQNKYQNDEINELKSINENLEEQLRKFQAEYQTKVFNLEEDLDSERKVHESRYESLKKKYAELNEDLAQNQKQNEEDRIEFIKKIEGLSFDISRKQKEIMQVNMKKQSLEASLAKKQSQFTDLKKTYNQQIESSLKKISQAQAKVQKINEEYMEFKIQAEKQNALAKQKNQFLSTKINDLMKQKELTSTKNLQKLDRIKITDLKEQVQKHKAQIISLESKNETMRKSMKESQLHYKKEKANFDKEKQYLSQKLQLTETKNKELESTVSHKNQKFMKETEELRVRHQEERVKLHKENDALKEKVNEIQDERNELSWKLQKQMALIGDKIKHAEYQRDQSKKQLLQTEKRLQLALNQLKKNTEKNIEESGIKKHSLDKRYTNQVEIMKMASKVRQEELEEANKKLKEDMSNLRQKNFELQESLAKAEKSRFQQKILLEQIENLKRQKQNLIFSHRNELSKESDEYRKKYHQLERKNRELERKNNEAVFEIEKVQARAKMQIDKLIEEKKKLEEQIQWLKQKLEMDKMKMEKGGNSQKRFSMTASDVLGWNK